MKGAFPLAVYAAILATSVAFGQTRHDPKPQVIYRPPPLNTAPHRPQGVETTPERVVITHGAGGVMFEHNFRFAGYRRLGLEVEIRGPCYSACTLITAYVSKAKLCIAEGAFFAFHAVRSAERQELMPAETAFAYWQQPLEIRAWIDRNGGYDKLPLDGFWTMYDRELWAIGYPKCAP